MLEQVSVPLVSFLFDHLKDGLSVWDWESFVANNYQRSLTVLTWYRAVRPPFVNRKSLHFWIKSVHSRLSCEEIVITSSFISDHSILSEALDHLTRSVEHSLCLDRTLLQGDRIFCWGFLTWAYVVLLLNWWQSICRAHFSNLSLSSFVCWYILTLNNVVTHLLEHKLMTCMSIFFHILRSWILHLG